MEDPLLCSDKGNEGVSHGYEVRLRGTASYAYHWLQSKPFLVDRGHLGSSIVKGIWFQPSSC